MRTHQQFRVVEAEGLEGPVDGDVERGVDDAADGARGDPLPGERAVAEDEVVRNFERLTVFVGLEEGAGEDHDDDDMDGGGKGCVRTVMGGRKI